MSSVKHCLPMTISDMAFLLERLYQDCSPLQFLRELTQNSIDSLRTRTGDNKKIIWDTDSTSFDATGIYKLSIADNGKGMTGDEMVRYINALSSSVHIQSAKGNFGVGAKISAAPRNREGLVYLSWKDGIGYQIRLHKDSVTGQYGLERFERDDGTEDFWAYAGDSLKPDFIKDSGTKIILLGNAQGEHTMDAPDSNPASPKKWVLRYLNGRYFEFPPEIEIRAREGWHLPKEDKHNFLRKITGMKEWLDHISVTHGAVDLPNASAFWWIVKKDQKVNAGDHPLPGHVGAIFENEIYEVAAGRQGIARLQDFGVIFGGSRVVIYIRPHERMNVTSDTARSRLLESGKELPWSEWASVFRENMPHELVELMQEIDANSAKADYRDAIRDRLKSMHDLLRFSSFKHSMRGKELVDEEDSFPTDGSSSSRSAETIERESRAEKKKARHAAVKNLYALHQSSGGSKPAKIIKRVMEPNVKWISVRTGTREKADLEDRAARFHENQNLLLINEDFRAYVDMIDRWIALHGQGARSTIVSSVQEWFEQQLVETIMAAQALRSSSAEWTTADVEKLLSEEALTAVVLARYHIFNNIKRSLGSKLGALRNKKPEI